MEVTVDAVRIKANVSDFNSLCSSFNGSLA